MKVALFAVFFGLVIAISSVIRSNREKLAEEEQRLGAIIAATENAARMEEYKLQAAELAIATDVQLREVATECVEKISQVVSATDPYRWSFTGIEPADFDALKYMALRNVPMSSYGIDSSSDLPIEMNVKEARSYIEYGMTPLHMKFVIYSIDDSILGLNGSLRVYTCVLGGLSALAAQQSDSFLIPTD